MSNDNVIKRLNPIFSRVAQQIKDHLASDVPFVMDVSNHILLSGGKHLRPTLFVLATRICGYQGGREIYFSSVFEYIHAATLLHDDVIDESDTRRGHKAAHLVYGNPGVILVGDFLLAKSTGLGAETRLLEFTEVMARTVSRMAEGEVLQLLHAWDPEITETEYQEVISRKTAVLMESACYLGAVLAQAPPEEAAALKEFGSKIGMAFQIIDDCLDYTADQDVFGKPVGHDLDEGKFTLPLIRTLAKADEAEKKELCRLITQKKRTSEEFARIQHLIDGHGCLEDAKQCAARFVREAQAALDIFPDSDLKTAMCDLAEFIVNRHM